MVPTKLLVLLIIYKTCDSQGMSAAIAEVANKEGASLVIVANSNTGKTIAPLAVKLSGFHQQCS